MQYIYDCDGLLLGFVSPKESGMPSSYSQKHGRVIQCIRQDGASVRPRREVDSKIEAGHYARVVEFVVHKTWFAQNPGRGETVILSLVLHEPFDELWDWPGFVRFTGWWS